MKYIKKFEDQNRFEENLKGRIKTRQPVEGLKYQVGDYVRKTKTNHRPDKLLYKIIEIDPKNVYDPYAIPYFIEDVNNPYNYSWETKTNIKKIPDYELNANKFNL